MLVSNDTLIVTTARSEDIARALAGGPYMTNGAVTTLYARFELKCAGLPTASGTYFTHFTGADRNGALTGHRARVWASTTNVAAGTLADPGTFFLSIVNGSGGNAANAQWATALNTNVTYTIVSRYDVAAGQATLWIDPASESDASVAAADYLDPTNYVNVTHYAFRQASGEGTMLIDNLKVGTSFNDVAGANTAPVISALANQAIPAGGSVGPLGFTVQDAESPAGDLVVTATSSNPALVPNDAANLVLGGSGSDRTIQVIPIAGAQGSALITVNVSDGVNTSFTTFEVQVGAPSIAAIPDQMVYTNVPVPGIGVAVSDAESDPLTLTATSSNPDLLPVSGISFSGNGANRTLTLEPAPGQTGVTVVSVSVTDGYNTNSSTFRLTVSPRLGLVFGEEFAYTNFTPGVGNALYQADGSPWQHVSGTYYELMVSNGLAFINHTNSEDLGAALTNAPYFGSNAVMFYTAFTVNFSYLPSSNGNYFLHLKASDIDTINFRGKVFASAAHAAEGKFRLGIANIVNSPVEFPQDLELGTYYTVIARYNSGTGHSTLWVNPTSEQSPGAVATDTPGSSDIGGIALREDTGMGDMAIGPIRIGTSFSDVFTVPPVPTPEPLQLMLSGEDLVLSWTNSAFSLGFSAQVAGPYEKIAGATSPYTNSIAPGTKFFRLVWP